MSPAKIASMIFPPPTSLVLVGISGFWGSEPLVVMMADPASGVASPPVQPVKTSAVATPRPAIAVPILLNLNFPPVQREETAARNRPVYRPEYKNPK